MVGNASAPWDVIVVGAGPAGSTTAGLLARRGHRVLLVDRAQFPRAKPCGESINPGAVRELETLRLLDSVLRLPHSRIIGWRVHSSGATLTGAEGGVAGEPTCSPFAGRYPPGVSGIGVDRRLLDSALLLRATEAGACLRPGAHVVDLIRRSGRVVGVRLADGEEVGARMVVGADGLRSVVVRRLGLLSRRPRLRKVAFTAHIELPDTLPQLGELHVRRWGCVGIAPVGSGVANVVVVLEGVESALRSGGSAIFDRATAGIPSLRGGRQISEVRATGPFDWPTRAVTAPGAILVGDAAGYYDPFTGQGIFAALRGARLAAAAVDRSLRVDASASAFREYGAAHRREFAPGRRLQRVIEAVTSRPALFHIAGSALRTWPPLADRLIVMTGDMRREPLEPSALSFGGA